MRSLFFVVLGLIAGVVIGFVLAPRVRYGDEPTRRAAPPSRDERGAASPEPGLPVPDGAPVEIRSEAAGVLAHPEIPERGRSDGHISGRVLDGCGRPVEGVTVRATFVDFDVPARPKFRWKRAQAAPRKEPPDERARATWQAVEIQRRGTVDALTGADGSYAIACPFAGSYQLQAWRLGWEIEAGHGPPRVRPGTTIDFQARELIPVLVRVSGAGVGVPQELPLEFSRAGAYGTESRSDHWYADDPTVFLEPGRWTVAIESSKPREWTCEPAEIVVRDGVAGHSVDVVLRPASGVFGRVVPSGGEDLGSLTVLAFPASAAPTDDPEACVARDPGLRKPYDFRVPLDPGSYIIEVRGTYGSDLLARVEVAVAGNFLAKDIEIPATASSRSVLVHLRDAAGRSVVDASFEIEVEARVTSRSCIRSGNGREGIVLRHAGGDFLVRIPGSGSEQQNPATAREDVCLITAKSVSFGRASGRFTRGESNEITLTFAPEATLAVTLRGYQHDRLGSRARAVLLPANEESSSYVERPFDPKGFARFAPVQAGNYIIEIQVRQDHCIRTIVRRDAVIAGGDNGIAFDLPQLWDLTLVVDGGGEGREVTLIGPFEGNATSTIESTDAAGQARFELLPAGRYRVTDVETEVSQEVSVPAASPIRVRFQ